MPLKVLDLFAGIGGFSLGLERAGFETVAFCECEPFCQKVLAKHWPGVPIYDDVRELTAKRLAGDGVTGISVITGGFPCQDISTAGRQAGIEGERSGLWSELARLIGELRPRYAILENVTNLLAGSTTERIPYDRCVCGWPYRRGGLHLSATQQEGEHLHAKGGCWHDEKSDADFSFFGSDWREGQADEEGHSEMGGGALLDVDWRTGASFPGLDIPALDIEAEAGGILHCSGAPLGLAAKAQERHNGMDSASETDCCAHQNRDSVPQQERPRDSGRGQTCDCCGRPVVYESSRLSEQSWFGRVLGDLAEIGYDAEWHCIPASHVGAHHRRDRVWIVAYPNGNGEPRGTEYAGAVCKAALLADADSIGNTPLRGQREDSAAEGFGWGNQRARGESNAEWEKPDGGAGEDSPNVPNPDCLNAQGFKSKGANEEVWKVPSSRQAGPLLTSIGGEWESEPNVGRVANGVPDRSHRLKALGNAVVPQIPELIGRAIMEAERGD